MYLISSSKIPRVTQKSKVPPKVTHGGFVCVSRVSSFTPLEVSYGAFVCVSRKLLESSSRPPIKVTSVGLFVCKFLALHQK